jgi:SSS family solute:Na+ symporter
MNGESAIAGLSLVDFVILAVYFLGILGFGLYMSRRVKGGADFFLAGRTLPFWAIGLSIVGSDIGAIDFVGLVGQTFRHGIVLGNMDWIGSMPALILVAFVFIPYYWRSGVYSVPEYLGRRYNQEVRLVQTIAWTLFMVSNLGITFWALAEMFHGLFGWDHWMTIAVMSVFTGTCAISGGLLSSVWTDVIQVLVMLTGATIVLVKGLVRLGGVGAMKEKILEAGHTGHFTLYHSASSTSPYPWPAILVGLVLVQSTAYFSANQAIVQRALGARDEWSAKAGTLFAGFFKFLIPFVVVVPGLVGLALYPEVSPENSDQVFSYMVRDLLPDGVRGIVVAGFIAGFMSNVDSMLNSAATMITQDICAGALRMTIDDRRALLMGRTITLCLILFGALTANISKYFTGVYAAIQSMLAILQGPTIALLFVGMFWRRATGPGGFAGVTFGLALAISLTVYHKVWGLFASEEPFFYIAPISCFATVAVLVGVSLLTPPKTAEELRGLIYTRHAPKNDASGTSA